MKKIFTVITIILILSVLFSACSEVSNDTITPVQSDKTETDNKETVGIDGENHSEEELEVSSFVSYGITIENVKDNNFKRELIGEIGISKTMSKEQQAKSTKYAELNLSDITEFYFNNLEIKGYELFQIGVTPNVFYYYYVPLKSVDKNADVSINYFFNRISISINRLDSPNAYAYKTIEEIFEMFGNGEIKENFIYAKNSNSITGFINKTNFYISVPDELNTYEYLRDLADDLIKNAELVDVQHELDVMKKNAD